MKRAVSGIFLSVCLNAQPASLEGTAIHAITKEPLSGVHIRLVAGTDGRPAGAYGAVSDRAGHFSIAGIEAGTYRLMPERAGLVYAPAKQTVPVVNLKPGQQIMDFQLEMAPLAAIAGRVVDEYGDPVANVPVGMVSTDPLIERAAIGTSSTTTNDRGEFRLARAPGKYRVVAMPFEAVGANEVPEIRSDGTSEAVYRATYYPSAAREDRAVAVEAAAGREVTGIEIRLVRKRSLSIGGVVKGPEGNVVASITMQHGENSQNISMSTGMGTGPDGKFLLTRLNPGYYRLYADYASGATRLQSQLV